MLRTAQNCSELLTAAQSCSELLGPQQVVVKSSLVLQVEVNGIILLAIYSLQPPGA